VAVGGLDLGVPVLLQCHYAGTRDEPLQKKVISKYDLISSPMVQDSVSKKDSNGFPKAVASAVSSMERRELSRCALAARVQHAGPSSATTIDYGVLHRCTPPPFQSGRRQPFSLQPIPSQHLRPRSLDISG
jgi:hypothetical protein